MKLNSIDIKKFNAKQMKVEFQPASRTTEAEWERGQRLPIEFETAVGFSSLKVTVYFKSSSRSNVQRSIAEFLSLIDGSVIIELDHYKGKYKGFMKSDPSITSTKELNKKIVTLEFKGYMYDEEIKVTVNGTNAEPVALVGAREAPCVLEINAKEEISNLIIKGFGNDDIVIDNMAKGELLIIDGIAGKVTVGGMNAFKKVDLWEFPYIKKKTTVSMSNSNADLLIRYYPMWV